MALMIRPYVGLNADYAVFLAFLSGIIIFLFGVLNLGKIFIYEQQMKNSRNSLHNY